MQRQLSPASARGEDAAALTGVNLADPRFWQQPAAVRDDAFARLRRLDSPAFFVERNAGSLRRRRGFYALVHHADVLEASRKPNVFISGPGVTTPMPARWIRAVLGDSMVNLDDPRHARLRGIISRAFTPRLVARIEEDIQDVATRVIDDVVRSKPEDFVESVATQLPFQVICNMMGIPERHRSEILQQVNHTTEQTEERSSRWAVRIPGSGLLAVARLHRLVAATAKGLRENPSDDLLSVLVNADVAGRRLTARESGPFFSLLLVAGVETTRNAIAHGLKLLTDNPGQRELLLSDFEHHIAGAVEEMVRFASPIIQFRRTVAQDYEMHGHRFRPGDSVKLFYNSANRDEAVFSQPDTFDITRKPNPQLGFGGGGPHFCLGAHLARREMTALFRELFSRLPNIRSIGEPELVASDFDNRVRHLRFGV
jgi:cytochrome P450